MLPNQLETIPHRRYNPLQNTWVLVSPQRDQRPWDGKKEKKISKVKHNNANYLQPGKHRVNGDEMPNYDSTFVFENDFPALYNEAEDINYEEGLLKAKSERGRCKVVCFSPDPYKSLATMTQKELCEVIHTWQKEFKELAALPYINHVQIFENKGEIMGCSNPHPHGQIWAQESIPTLVEAEHKAQQDYFKENKKVLLLEYLKQEEKEGIRIIDQNDHFTTLVPFWATWPFETMIIPRTSLQDLNGFDQEISKSFAKSIKTIAAKYDKVFNCSFPYSAGIHQAPTTGEDYSFWQLHMHFYPPLLRSASVKKFMVGYEMLGEPQRDITPEKAARILKQL